ncbi:MAG: hypothetical protein FJ087_18740 [Deltaproteobacteria bacterium]|nr:hypothetical protein [Deltaproteobacteria bacterium]
MPAGRSTPSNPLLGANLLALAAHVALVVGWFRMLPERYPCHFDAAGVADAWTRGDDPRWFIGLAGAVVVDGMMLGLSWLMWRIPLRWMNLPDKQRLLALPAEAVAPIRKALSDMLLSVGILVVILFTAVFRSAFRAATGASERFESGIVFAATALVLAGTIVQTVRLYRVVREVARRAP